MIEAVPTTQTSSAALAARALAYMELTRPRIALLVLAATALGFAASRTVEYGAAMATLFAHTMLGTGMIAAGANSLNQWLEADLDGLMVRTMHRPVPSGRLCRREALAFGLAVGVGGVCYLTFLVNGLAGLFGGITLASYALIYTPLKRRGWQSVFVGALPGAMPPVIGSAGAAGSVSSEVWVLFAIVYFWQLPHFAAIAWLHRTDYARAGYKMLSVVDASGRRLSRHMVAFSIVLLAVSLLPTIRGTAGIVYGVGAAALGLAFLGCGVAFTLSKSAAAARCHLLASIIYLPVLIGLLLVDLR